MSRRAQIEAMLADDPQDQFLRYALAMEMEKAGENEAALELFAQLQHDASPYVPAYFRAGQLFAKLERYNEARSALREGIQTADRVGDLHAAGEMREFLTGLGQFGE